MTEVKRTMPDRPLYVAIATALQALHGCRSDNANESQRSWASRWESFLERAANELPQGGGFDSYPVIDTDSKLGTIKITGSYHNMDEHGGYAGWSDYTVTVTASLTRGFDLRIVGGKSDWKEYAYECFQTALAREFPRDAFHESEV